MVSSFDQVTEPLPLESVPAGPFFRIPLQIYDASAQFEVGKPRGRRESVDPPKIELFQAREFEKALREFDQRIAAQIDLP